MAVRRSLGSGRGRSDYGTAERGAHGGVVFVPTSEAGVLAARALVQNVLDSLVLMQALTEAQREAGLVFQRDFRDGGLEQRLTGSYNPTPCRVGPFGTWDERSDEEEFAYKRWQAAVRALGPGLASVVINVACFDMWPGERDCSRLERGLDFLRGWYRLAAEERGGDS